MALTVAEIADLIRRPEAETAAIVERVRAWSDAGLLQPTGDPNPGTGVKRTYDFDAAYVAGILNALADMGLPIGRQRHAVNVLFVVERAKSTWAKRRRGGLVLEIADFGDADPAGRRHAVFFHEGRKKDHLGNLIHPRADGSIVLNISRLFARIESRQAEWEKVTAKAKAKAKAKAEAKVRERELA
jgi:hypothetical protein